MRIDRKLAEDLIFGGEKLRRFTQDSPILPDIWSRYADSPDGKLELLLTPYGEVTSGKLSVVLRKRLEDERERAKRTGQRGKSGEPPSIAYNQSVVLANLGFDELVRTVLPLSEWWIKSIAKGGLKGIAKSLEILASKKDLEKILDPDSAFRSTEEGLTPEFIWMARLVGTIEFCRKAKSEDKTGKSSDASEVFAREDIKPKAKNIVAALRGLLEGIKLAETDKPKVFSVNRNREARPALTRSVKTIKADAANLLFSSSCKDLAWAMIDSGIDARHGGFRLRDEKGQLLKEPFVLKNGEWKNQTRVTATYDFTIISKLLNIDELSSAGLPKSLRQRMDKHPQFVKDLRLSLSSGREIDWSLYLPLIEISHARDSYIPPTHEHGTHVAGILAADWRKKEEENPEKGDIKGVCPDIKLYDLRVFDNDGTGDEFSIMAALQFVRYLNAHKDVMEIHGVNLSMSIHHEVENYACGRTPVCLECERLVGAGIVVVAASGNLGYVGCSLSAGAAEEGYRSISITDPGNAQSVITVGATHAGAPHNYGVSYFSSRGPTGDGRLKPDLVAPGEKINSLVPENGLKVIDGTSMAAPHVSGAAALLMARYPELIGDPERIKQILCKTATDLGREPYFQGAGLVDILRALQSV